MSIALKGVPLILSTGANVDAAEHLAGKVVALYFSASWCPPCRAFTPKLKAFYEKLEANKKLEVIFVSRDPSEEKLLEYYHDHHAKWAYIPFGNPAIAQLLAKYQVRTIPCLRVIKSDGTVVVEDARTEVAVKGEKANALFAAWESLVN